MRLFRRIMRSRFFGLGVLNAHRLLGRISVVTENGIRRFCIQIGGEKRFCVCGTHEE